MNRSHYSFVAAASLMCASVQVHADEPSSQATPTRHQLMKDCMAKQKASDGGIPKDQMKRNCKDLTKTESANAKTEKAAADQPPAAPPK